MKIELGTVGHFGLAVRDPQESARWWRRIFAGIPRPETIGHMSFHLPNKARLREALDALKKHRVEVEDPGEEIGPEAPGSPNVGIWFRDPDGYRWELSVQANR